MPTADQHQSKARFCAALLVLPALALALSPIVLLSWLWETRDRLDTDYWEAQLAFAFGALVIALCGVPFVLIRVARVFPRCFTVAWVVVIAGYLALLAYMSQSHFPQVGKALCLSTGAFCLALAVKGLSHDIRSRHQNGEQDAGDQAPAAVE